MVVQQPAREHFVFVTPQMESIFYIVFYISIVVFVALLYQRVRIYGIRDLLNGLRESGVKNLRILIRNGLGQRIVARKGIGGGRMHLAIYSGTLILFIGTSLVFLDDRILNPLGHVLLKERFYLFFESSLDLFGILFIVGVVWAISRRVGKPPYLKNRRGDFVILFALLYMGVSGFILEGLRLVLKPVSWGIWSFLGFWISRGFGSLSIEPQILLSTYQILWLGHGFATFVIIASLPYSSLYHILASGLNMLTTPSRHFGKLTTPFNLKQVMETGDFDLKIGFDKPEEISWQAKISLDSCTNCGRCEEVCPASKAGMDLSPRVLIQDLARGMRSQIPDLFQGVVREDEVWSCTTCSACIYECPVLIDQPHLIVDLRRSLVAKNKIDSKKGQFLTNLASYQNPYGGKVSDRASWSQDLGLKTYSGNEEYLYWVGCAGAYDTRIQNVTKAMVKILTHSGVSFGILAQEEKCTGEAARRMGEEGRFQELAMANIELLKGRGVKKIITHCPHCFNTFKNEYPEFGGQYEVIHHSQFISQLVSEKKLKLKESVDFTAALHDSCYLGRVNGIFEEPRKVLTSVKGLDLKELPTNRERGLCCGGGGACAWYDVPKREKISQVRLKEVAQVKPDVLAVECPFCLSMLEDAAKSTPTDQVLQVKDIAEIVADALE